MSVAAALAVLLAGGWFWRADTLNDRRLAEEGEIVLDVLGFASADEFYADASFRIVPSIEGLDYFNAEAQSCREVQRVCRCENEIISSSERGCRR